MEVVAERVRDRIAALEPSEDAHGAVQRVLEQLLPLDEERRTEMEIWLAFTARAQVDESLREQRQAMHEALRQFVRWCLDALAKAGLLGPDLSLEIETSRLHALLDGLALHGITSPETMPARRQRALLGAHLTELARGRIS